MNWVKGCGWLRVAAALGAALTPAGCGMPGAPLPPSLNLAIPVKDLSATRAGDQVALHWTMPQKNTDKLLLKGVQQVAVCRTESDTATCSPVTTLQVAPEHEGDFADTLPAALAAGAPRVLTYFVEVQNNNGRSAGLSNAAVVLAGAAPEAVTGLAARVRKDGVVLGWDSAPREATPTAVRLRRKLLTPVALGKKKVQGPLAPAPEPTEQSLLVEATRGMPDKTLDKDIRFGETYEYRAQRVARVKVDGQTRELSGPLSAPVRVDAVDVFPPAVPTGLAAVAVAAEAGGAAAIDLSWQPDAEADLAGYIVYRREADSGWQRISPAGPVVGPAFHDAHVLTGHSYRYAVSAIDEGGHESGRSGEAEETVPEP